MAAVNANFRKSPAAVGVGRDLNMTDGEEPWDKPFCGKE
jgi:hypothetical protein